MVLFVIFQPLHANVVGKEKCPAKAVLYIEDNNLKLMKTTAEMLSSYPFAQLVSARLKLDQNAHFLASIGIKEQDATFDNTATALKSLVETTYDTDTHSLTIFVNAPEPNLSVVIANAYCDEYIRYVFERRADASKSATQFLLEEADRLRKDIRSLDEKIQNANTIDADDFKRQQDADKSLYQAVLAKLKNVDINKQLTDSPVKIIERASLEYLPSQEIKKPTQNNQNPENSDDPDQKVSQFLNKIDQMKNQNPSEVGQDFINNTSESVIDSEPEKYNGPATKIILQFVLADANKYGSQNQALVGMGAQMYNALEIKVKEIKRGKPVRSGISRSIPAGTELFPIRVAFDGGLVNTLMNSQMTFLTGAPAQDSNAITADLYFYKDAFGDWNAIKKD